MTFKRPVKNVIPGLLIVGCIILFISSLFVLILPKKDTQSCANSISCIKNLTGEYEPDKMSIFLGKKISPPVYLTEAVQASQVLGNTNEKKHIFVNLSTQTLYAYQGNKLVYNFLISSGKWGKTPTGDFRIWIKLRNTRMEGGSGSDYYNLYNVPFTMFFYNDGVAKERGFSLHGAYWHNNFGYVMSHGCVNIRPEDAEKLYVWADPPTGGNLTYATQDNPGTLVTIYGEPPI